MPLLMIMEQASSTNVWSPAFVRDGFNNDDVVSFFNKLNDAKLGDSPHVIVRWNLDSKLDVTTKSCYLKLLHLNSLSLHDLFRGGFPQRLICRFGPLKVSFFV